MPSPSPTPQTMVDASFRNFSEFQHCIGWWRENCKILVTLFYECTQGLQQVMNTASLSQQLFFQDCRLSFLSRCRWCSLANCPWEIKRWLFCFLFCLRKKQCLISLLMWTQGKSSLHHQRQREFWQKSRQGFYFI